MLGMTQFHHNVCVLYLQNVCAPETRGTAFAIFNLTDDIGKGAGPGESVLLLCVYVYYMSTICLLYVH